MRTKTQDHSIKVNNEVYLRLKKDKKHFEEIIKGGTWSISDVITEYFKIIKSNLSVKDIKELNKRLIE